MVSTQCKNPLLRIQDKFWVRVCKSEGALRRKQAQLPKNGNQRILFSKALEEVINSEDPNNWKKFRSRHKL
ncbi:MAG: hypothetical protein CL685_02880 [Candidatus Magasanikbacteria bacterium]|nr:hypothetical protein [Candidatus Magasanikbacteria bacterium]